MPPIHTKSDAQIDADREKLKKVALLWWSQQIYQLADAICQPDGYKTGHTRRGCYRDVLSVLAGTIEQLKKIEKNPSCKGTEVVEALGKAGMRWGLDSTGKRLRDHVKAKGASNCAGDADVPRTTCATTSISACSTCSRI